MNDVKPLQIGSKEAADLCEKKLAEEYGLDVSKLTAIDLEQVQNLVYIVQNHRAQDFAAEWKRTVERNRERAA